MLDRSTLELAEAKVYLNTSYFEVKLSPCVLKIP